eukprot:1148236-Pelagomonas_calceolata.AAC.3
MPWRWTGLTLDGPHALWASSILLKEKRILRRKSVGMNTSDIWEKELVLLRRGLLEAGNQQTGHHVHHAPTQHFVESFMAQLV